MEPVYDALIARVDGVDIKGQPLNVPSLPSKDEINALAEEDLALTKPVDDELMTIQNCRKNGSVETKEVKLGDTMHPFKKLVDQKRAELEGLLEELKDVDAEIAAARKDVTETEQCEVKKAKKELNAELESLIDQASAIKEQTLAEVKKARQEGQAAKVEMRRKIDELMALF